MIEVSMEGRLVKVTMETTEAVELCTVIERAFHWEAETEGGLRARVRGLFRVLSGQYRDVMEAARAEADAWLKQERTGVRGKKHA